MPSSLIIQSEEELKERLKKRRAPLRKPTYDEEKYKKMKRARRVRGRYDVKLAQEPHKDPETKQTNLGGAVVDK